MNKRKRFTALILTVIILIGLIPTSAFAEGAAETPVITTDLSTEPVNYTAGDTATPLSITVQQPADGGTLSYQWYSSTTSISEGFSLIDNAEGNSYTPFTEAAGTTYYYVTVTNTLDGAEPATATSAAATVVVAEAHENHPPIRKSSVEATVSEEITAGESYTLDLAAIFEDEDQGDTLTYKVKIDEEAEAEANGNYSYTPAEAGEYVLVFRAYDGTEHSTDTYTVTLTVAEAGVPIMARLVGESTPLTITESLYPAPTLDGIYLLTVPSGTTQVELEIGGYYGIVDQSGNHLIAPALGSDGNTCTYSTYSEGVYSAVLEEFGIMYESISPYGFDDAQATYAFIDLFNENFDSKAWLVIQIEREAGAVPELIGGVYQISNAQQFAWFRDLVNGLLTDGTPQNAAADAKLTADIDMSAVCGATAGESGAELSWTPIGTSDAPYTGDFNGNGKKLDHLYINATSSYVGLFGCNSGMIRNLTIASGTINSNSLFVASIAGENKGTIVNCMNRVDVASSSRSAGGLVASSESIIKNCVNTGNVTVTGRRGAFAGGITGSCSYGTIENCYNTGAIESSVRAGGITGIITTEQTIINCYNAGNVNGTSEGGVIGYLSESALSSVTLNNNHFLQTDTINAGLSAIGADSVATEDQARAVSQAELQGLAETLGEAYMSDSTNINNGYPVLEWQITGEGFSPPIAPVVIRYRPWQTCGS